MMREAGRGTVGLAAGAAGASMMHLGMIGAVSVGSSRQVVETFDAMPLHRRGQAVGTLDAARIGVDQKLGRVEAKPVLGAPGAVRPQAVALTGGEARDEAVMDIARPLGKRDAQGFGTALVEQAELDPLGIGGVHRDSGTAFDQDDAERFRRSGRLDAIQDPSDLWRRASSR